jgi:hypothetical protein
MGDFPSSGGEVGFLALQAAIRGWGILKNENINIGGSGAKVFRVSD